MISLTKEQLEVIYFLNKCSKVDVYHITKGTWYINEKTGLVDIDGDFCCEYEGLKDFKGVRFGVVKGDFSCSNNELTSLEGAPRKVGGSFFCGNNQLTSLVGAPQKVGGNFDCFNNKLTSLEGAPQKVGGYFDCRYNNLTSLEGAPQKVGESFYCSHNPISWETLELVWNTMKEKKIDYWMALSILKNKISKNDFNKLSVGLDERLPKDTQKGISMLGRFGHFD